MTPTLPPPPDLLALLGLRPAAREEVPAQAPAAAAAAPPANGRVAALEGDVRTLKTDLGSVDKRVTGVQGQVGQVNTGLSTQIRDTKTELERKISAGDSSNATSITTVRDQVGAQDTRLKAVEARKLELSSTDRGSLDFVVANKSALTALAGKQPQITDIATNFDAKVSAKVSAAIPADLTGRVNAGTLFRGVPQADFNAKAKTWFDGSGLKVLSITDVQANLKWADGIKGAFPGIDKLAVPAVRNDLLKVPNFFNGMTAMKGQFGLASNIQSDVTKIIVAANALDDLETKFIGFLKDPGGSFVKDPGGVLRAARDAVIKSADAARAAAAALTTVQSILKAAGNAIPSGL